MKKIKNKENGITIVSLVVTIMIMLILIGITINGSFALAKQGEHTIFISEIGELQEKIKRENLKKQMKNENESQCLKINDYLGIESRFNDYLLIINGELKYISNKTPEKEIKWLKSLGINEIGHFYYVELETNGGTLENTKIIIIAGEKLPTPSKEEDTFVGWNTKQDGSGTMFSPDEEIDELQINDGETITLYAQWKNYVYCLDNANFDGTANTIIDTGICLFNDENVNKNFRIKFTVEDYDESYNDPANVSDNNSYPTIMSAMYEKASPFQGFVFRIMNNKNTSAYQLRLNNTTTGEFNNTYKLQKSLDVDLIRENGAMYLRISKGLFTNIYTYPSEIVKSDVPLTFGGNINAEGIYDRFFKGTLSNISVEFFDTPIVEDLNNQIINNINTYTETKTASTYKLDGTILFDGSNYIDTGINVFSPENINRDFDINFTINSVGFENITNSKQNTVINLKDEALNNYPGVCFRYTNTNEMQFSARWPSQSDVNKTLKLVEPYQVSILRRSNVLYYKINAGEQQTIISVPPEAFNNTFGVNVTVGASLDNKHKPFRNFIGILSDISVELK